MWIMFQLEKEKKRGMINMLKALMETADNMLEQMGNASKEMETLRKNQKEMLENKSIMWAKEARLRNHIPDGSIYKKS